jgi:hypothetical protein
MRNASEGLQIFPFRALADLGRRRGIPVIVDGAHAFAHFDFKLSDLGMDYFATSLHQEDGFTLHTSLKPEFSCGIGNIQLEGVDSGALGNWLRRGKHVGDEVQG